MTYIKTPWGLAVLNVLKPVVFSPAELTPVVKQAANTPTKAEVAAFVAAYGLK
jgi:hypothetical protein